MPHTPEQFRRNLLWTHSGTYSEAYTGTYSREYPGTYSDWGIHSRTCSEAYPPTIYIPE